MTSAIDNLVKGAAGQAVQNANLMLGLDETRGAAAHDARRSRSAAVRRRDPVARRARSRARIAATPASLVRRARRRRRGQRRCSARSASKPQFVDGRRVTSDADIDIVRMALSGSANKRLVAALVEHGVSAVGLSGEDAALIAATPLDPEQLGYVGAPHASQRRRCSGICSPAATCR